MQDEPLTEEMLDELLSTPRVQTFLDAHNLDTPSLAMFLNEQLAARNLKQSDVLRVAGIEPTFGWYIFNGQRGAGRDNVLKICFAMGFDVRTANRALQAAGANTLYPKNRRDAIIIYCLGHSATLLQANEALYGFGEECL
jgi:hypothetical protein